MANLLAKLSQPDSLSAFLSELQQYEADLLMADQLNADQTQALANAKELLAEEEAKVVAWLGLAAWQALTPDANGSEVQKAKAIALALDGDSTAMRNAFVLANAPALLGIDAEVPKHISASGVVQLGAKAKRNSDSSSANGERLSLRKVPAGSNFWYKYSSIWYQIIGTSTGVRLFNLSTRVEVTDKNDLPQSASACQKLICIGTNGVPWGAAFRGYVDVCPENVNALTESELLA